MTSPLEPRMQGPTADEQREHVRFLEAYYSKVHGFYDATRKYFLLGRDRLLEQIAEDQPEIIIEVGCGTGRNLRKLRRMLPGARFGAIEPCPSMREHALRKIPGLRVTPEFAEDADLTALFSAKPDAILLSYTLSMMRDPVRALRNCVGALAPGGRVYAVDFGNGRGLGGLGRKLFLGGLKNEGGGIEPLLRRAQDGALRGSSRREVGAVRAQAGSEGREPAGA